MSVVVHGSRENDDVWEHKKFLRQLIKQLVGLSGEGEGVKHGNVRTRTTKTSSQEGIFVDGKERYI